MPSIWTVKPDDIKIELVWESGGETMPFWIKIKKLLTVGEDRRVRTAGFKGVSGAVRVPGDTAPLQTETRIDWRTMAFVRAETYLTDWSLTDDKDKRLKVNIETIESLHPDVFDLIENAISAHVEAVAQEKKATNGTTPPSETAES